MQYKKFTKFEINVYNSVSNKTFTNLNSEFLKPKIKLKPKKNITGASKTKKSLDLKISKLSLSSVFEHSNSNMKI